MIRTRLYRNGKCVKENFDPAEISEHLEAKDACVVWMDLDAPNAEDLKLLAEEFGLNPLAVEDATTERQRPKLDHYDDHVFISLYDVSLDDKCQVVSHELAIFAAQRYLITVRKTPGYSMDQIVSRWDDNDNLAEHGVGYLLWGLLDVVVDGHFDTVQALDDRIDTLEDLLFEPGDTGTAVQRESYDLRKALVRIRRVVLPTREILNSLMRRESNLVDDALMPYYQDVYDHVLRAADWTDSLRDLVSTILETHLTIQGNRMNEIMKKVTSWAAIAAVPAVVTGYYGMNVVIYPHAGTEAGGLAALGLMVGLVALLYAVFKRSDWL
ncbi:MAG TPA: magnesium transporter CorA family protein [Mycobacteriales bacterium]|nr:magnesium transporter CorA family protein [Mycobacteriales bacterium]